MSGVRPIAGRLADERGFVLWDLEFRHEGGADTLRVSIDRRGGIDTEEISAYAEALTRHLDQTETVPGEGRWLLEVSSPGAERRLRTPQQFALCEGRYARVTFRSGREPVEGFLGESSGDSVVIRSEDGDVTVAFCDISQARLKLPEA
jgi:ribosome maturation factor RimP